MLKLMAKKKPNIDKSKKASEPVVRTLRINPVLDAQLMKLVELMASDVTTEIRIAIRERLERHKFWPPNQEKKGESQ